MSIKDAARRSVLGGTDRRVADLEARVTVLEQGLEESRRLNERLADVLEVVTELLLPAVDRDEEQLRQGLEKLGRVV